MSSKKLKEKYKITIETQEQSAAEQQPSAVS